MGLEKQLEYSNISEYRIGDVECENLVLKALKYKVGTIVVGSSALKLVSDMLKDENGPEVCVAVSYPSGAYIKEAKVQEIEGLLELGYKIDGFYVVMQVGAYLSGKKEEAFQEMKALVEAAKGIPIKLITELGVLSHEQMQEICRMAVEAGISAIVTSAGFLPYGVPQANKEDYHYLVKMADGKLEIIAHGNIQTREEAEELLALGVDKVCTTKAYEMLR